MSIILKLKKSSYTSNTKLKINFTCSVLPFDVLHHIGQGRIQVWADPAPAPSFDSQIMQIQPFFGLYQPFGPLFLQI